MKTMGIVLDKYKRKIFRRGLKRAGFDWTESDGLTPDTILMRVITDDKEALHRVIRTCEAQARRIKKR